ncbi:MAG: O-acetyl-ADP-ribose deacetylase [Candidatus Melainabacteria bacterium]|nr:MAG: O-acetyl-ADP-ribose deacetylase [Candidatus Melainabacteria bacterium]
MASSSEKAETSGSSENAGNSENSGNSKKVGNKIIRLVRGDITREEVDAIVNAANSTLMGGGGVDGAIHRAGGPQILEECKQIRAIQGPLPPGQAVITGGGKLKAQYVIHTVGPIWRNGSSNEEETLASAYRESLILAAQYELRTVSFPSISTGAYGFPLDKAAPIAVSTAHSFLQQDNSVEEVRFVLFDTFAFNEFQDALNAL